MSGKEHTLFLVQFCQKTWKLQRRLRSCQPSQMCGVTLKCLSWINLSACGSNESQKVMVIWTSRPMETWMQQVLSSKYCLWYVLLHLPIVICSLGPIVSQSGSLHEFQLSMHSVFFRCLAWYRNKIHFLVVASGRSCPNNWLGEVPSQVCKGREKSSYSSKMYEMDVWLAFLFSSIVVLFWGGKIIQFSRWCACLVCLMWETSLDFSGLA